MCTITLLNLTGIMLNAIRQTQNIIILWFLCVRDFRMKKKMDSQSKKLDLLFPDWAGSEGSNPREISGVMARRSVPWAHWWAGAYARQCTLLSPVNFILCKVYLQTWFQNNMLQVAGNKKQMKGEKNEQSITKHRTFEKVSTVFYGSIFNKESWNGKLPIYFLKLNQLKM